MTTRVHVVNFGPDPIIVSRPNQTVNEMIWSQESKDYYVYEGAAVVIKEVKPQQAVDVLEV